MLLSLTGKMPEALIAISNSIDLANSKPSDDALALARAHDALGRTLLAMNKTKLGITSLRKAVAQFQEQGKIETAEARAILQLSADKTHLRSDD